VSIHVDIQSNKQSIAARFDSVADFLEWLIELGEPFDFLDEIKCTVAAVDDLPDKEEQHLTGGEDGTG
jgi:hypothetical protein